MQSIFGIYNTVTSLHVSNLFLAASYHWQLFFCVSLLKYFPVIGREKCSRHVHNLVLYIWFQCYFTLPKSQIQLLSSLPEQYQYYSCSVTFPEKHTVPFTLRPDLSYNSKIVSFDISYSQYNCTKTYLHSKA